MMGELTITVTHHGAVAEIIVGGRLSSAEADAFESHLRQAVEDGAVDMVVDMTRITFISSSGLRALILTAKALNSRSGRIHLFGLGETIREVFEVSGLFRVFRIHACRDEALAAAAH